MYLSWTLLRRSIAQTKGRLALIVGAVALGVLLLLSAAAFHNGLTNDSSHRFERVIAAHMKEQQSEGKPGPDPAVSIRAYHDVRDPLMSVDGNRIKKIVVDTTQSVNPPSLYGLTWPQTRRVLRFSRIAYHDERAPGLSTAVAFWGHRSWRFAT